MEHQDPEPLESGETPAGLPGPGDSVWEPAFSGRAEPPTIILQPIRGGLLGRLIAVAGWLGFAACALLLVGQYSALSDYFDTSEGITESYHSGAKYGREKVAVISVRGVITTGDGFVKQQIDRVREDKNVKAVVLRVESPGGMVTGADYILHHLRKLCDERKLPVVVSMGGIAASGGYYVAMVVGDRERSIFAEPTTTTGSIGVIIPHYDFSGLLARFDVKDDSLATHPRKDMLSMTKPMPEDHRQVLKEYLDEAFWRFKEVVKEGRPAFRKDEAALEELATGQVFTALQAKANGLVDEIGFIEDAIQRVCELAKLDVEKTRVVQYERPLSLFNLGLVQARPNPPQLTQILDMNAPRAYYLWSALPPLMTSRDP
jgi:protease-4